MKGLAQGGRASEWQSWPVRAALHHVWGPGSAAAFSPEMGGGRSQAPGSSASFRALRAGCGGGTRASVDSGLACRRHTALAPPRACLLPHPDTCSRRSPYTVFNYCCEGAERPPWPRHAVWIAPRGLCPGGLEKARSPPRLRGEDCFSRRRCGLGVCLPSRLE